MMKSTGLKDKMDTECVDVIYTSFLPNTKVFSALVDNASYNS